VVVVVGGVLRGRVPVVEVDRHRADGERGEEALEPLDPVRHAEADVLPRLQPDGLEVPGELVDASAELGVGPALVAAHECLALGDSRPHRLPEVGEVERLRYGPL
jgi:hypothetical protein